MPLFGSFGAAVSLFEIKKLLSLFTQIIPALPVLLILLGLYTARFVRWSGIAIVFIAALLLAFSSPAIHRLIVPLLDEQYPPLSRAPESANYIVVFSGGSHRQLDRDPPISLSATQLARLHEAVRLWKLNPKAKFITTGAHFGRTTSSAMAMATIAAHLGVNEEHIVQLDTVKDTHEEVATIADLVADAPVVLVSSAFHLPRIAKLAERYNLSATYAPSDWMDSSSSWWRFNAQNIRDIERILHEYVGMWWYRFRLK